MATLQNSQKQEVSEMGAVGQILKELMFGKKKNNKLKQKKMNNAVLMGSPQTQRPEI